jgi:hypothetical protein
MDDGAVNPVSGADRCPGLPDCGSPSGPEQGSALYLAGVCLVASLGGFLFGFDTAVISGTVDFVRAQYSLDEFGEGWFTSSALVGCIAGAAAVGFLSDRFGRRRIPPRWIQAPSRRSRVARKSRNYGSLAMSCLDLMPPAAASFSNSRKHW